MSAEGRLVVGAAILDDTGRLLGAKRGEPRSYAGYWEFPGGKAEPEEEPTQALKRECREELGVEVAVGDMVGEVSIAIGTLRVYLARITSGEPTAHEHAELRWLAAAELADVDWIPADWPLVERLRESRFRG